MTDERDHPGRRPHRDHAARARTPVEGVPVARVASGEIDATDLGDTFDEDTPIGHILAGIEGSVGPLSRRERMIVEAIHEHQGRRQTRATRRAANHMLEVEHVAATGVDRAQLASLLREDMAGWEPFRALGQRIEALESDRHARDGVIALVRRVGWWAKGGMGAAVFALLTAIYGAGVKAGKADAADRSALEAQRRLDEAVSANHRQDVEISALRALVRVRRALPIGDDTP